MCGAASKYTKVVLVLFVIVCISLGKCQEDDEDEEEYEEDNVDDATTRKYRLRTSSTTTTTTESPDPPASGRNETTQDRGSNSTEKAVASTSNSSSSGGASAAAAAATPAPSTRAPSTYPTPGTRGTTPADSEEEIETTTEEEGLGYVFRPLNSLIDNIVAGNVSGIVDHALSIRTPPEIRDFVNHVMNNVFGVGIGSALRQFMPSLFTTSAPQVTGRDPIPNQEPSQVAAPAPAQIAIPIQAIIDARSNATEDGKQSKTQQDPLQLKFNLPGAVKASRLRCEVIDD